MNKLALTIALVLPVAGAVHLSAVEIPLESLSPARIGYVDLQKVFDTYPEKAFAEGDLLKEIEKRKRELNSRQSLINTLRQQISADQTALDQGKNGTAVVVPTNNVPDLSPAAPAPVPTPAPVQTSSGTVAASTFGATGPYPMEDPLAGLPGHEAGTIIEQRLQGASAKLPGMNPASQKTALLDQLSTGSPVTLSPEAQSALQRRIDDNKKQLERKVAEFRMFRTNALADMKVLQTQKTYAVMSKIYAIMQSLARDEGVTVVLDKSYVLYGEDTVDLSDKLIARLQQTEGQ